MNEPLDCIQTNGTVSRLICDKVPYIAFGAFVASGILGDYGSDTLASIVDQTALTSVRTIVEYAVFAAALLVSAFKPKGFRLWQAALLGGSFCLFLLSGDFCTSSILLFDLTILLMIAGKDLDRLCRVYFVTCISSIVILILLTSLGACYNRDVIPNTRLVFSYGIKHPNTAAALLLSALSAMAYYCWDKKTWLVPSVLSFISAAFSYFTLSSNASSLLLVLLGVAIVLGHRANPQALRHGHRSLILSTIAVLILGFFLVMLIGTIFYSKDNLFWCSVDNLSHGRIANAHEYFAKAGGFTLFGRNISTPSYYHTGLPFFVLDSGYCRLSLIYGIIPAVAMYAVLVASLRRLSGNKKILCVAALALLYALHMTVETHGLYLYGCSALVFMSASFASPSDGRVSVDQKQGGFLHEHNFDF